MVSHEPQTSLKTTEEYKQRLIGHHSFSSVLCQCFILGSGLTAASLFLTHLFSLMLGRDVVDL